MAHTRISDFPEKTFGTGAVSILYNAGFFLGGNGLNIVIRFCYAVLLTRFLGPELYGYFAYGMSWYLSFLPFTSLGLDVILGRRIGKDHQDGSSAVPQTFTLKIAACAVTASVCALAGWFLEARPEMKNLLLIFSFALFGRAMAIWVDSVFAAYEKMKYALRLSVIYRPFEIAAGIIALFSGGGILSLAFVQAVSWWAQATHGLAILHHQKNKIRFSKEIHAIKSILSSGIPIMVGGVLLNWIVQGPLVLYRKLSEDPDGLGQFALAVQLFLVLSHVPRALNVAALPVLSRSVVRRDGKDVYYVSLVIRMAIVFGTCLGLLCQDIGPWLVVTVFGDRFALAARLLSLSVWFIIPWTCGSTVLRCLMAQGKYYTQILWAGIGSAALLISMPFFINGFGVIGAVASAGTGMTIWCLGMMGLMIRSGELSIWQAAVKPLIASGTGLGVYLCLPGIGPLTALPISLAALLAIVTLIKVFTAYERSILLKAAKSVTTRKEQPDHPVSE